MSDMVKILNICLTSKELPCKPPVVYEVYRSEESYDEKPDIGEDSDIDEDRDIDEDDDEFDSELEMDGGPAKKKKPTPKKKEEKKVEVTAGKLIGKIERNIQKTDDIWYLNITEGEILAVNEVKGIADFMYKLKLYKSVSLRNKITIS